jgi:hypothetical protein
MDKSFLVLFFKKELLSFGFSLRPRRRDDEDLLDGMIVKHQGKRMAGSLSS